MNASRPDLSIVVVTHNRCDLAVATMRSAKARTGDITTEWFAVDSGSSDGTPDTIGREWPDVRVVRMGNVGFAAANNVALSCASGRYILLLNPDVEIADGTLAQLVAALDDRPEVGAASVVQRSPDGGLLPSIRRFPSIGRQLGEALFATRWPLFRGLQEAETRAPAYASERSVDWLVGAFLIVRAKAAEEVGGLDERFFLYSEEKDWCYRLRRSGWDVRHLPVMTVTHHTGGYERADLAAQLSFSKLLFMQKHFGRITGLVFRVALVIRHTVRVLLIAPVAVVKRRFRKRAHAEAVALALTLGISPPPFQGNPKAHDEAAEKAVGLPR